jgi:hypothetical protein
MKYLSKEYLGSGAHWIVYRIHKNHEEDGKYDNLTSLVAKISNNGNGDVDRNIKNYDKVSSAKLPTLKYYFSDIIDDNPAILAEDLNIANDIIYVSPNTAKHIHSQINGDKRSNVAFTDLNEMYNSDLYCALPRYESLLLKKGITEILNIEELSKEIEICMRSAAENGIGMFEDAFFFGVNTHGKAKCTLNVKIADFDSIIIRSGDVDESFVNRNILAFTFALSDFVEAFVEKRALKKQYTEYLRERISILRSEIRKLKNRA